MPLPRKDLIAVNDRIVYCDISLTAACFCVIIPAAYALLCTQVMVHACFCISIKYVKIKCHMWKLSVACVVLHCHPVLYDTSKAFTMCSTIVYQPLYHTMNVSGGLLCHQFAKCHMLNGWSVSLHFSIFQVLHHISSLYADCIHIALSALNMLKNATPLVRTDALCVSSHILRIFCSLSCVPYFIFHSLT